MYRPGNTQRSWAVSNPRIFWSRSSLVPRFLQCLLPDLLPLRKSNRPLPGFILRSNTTALRLLVFRQRDEPLSVLPCDLVDRLYSVADCADTTHEGCGKSSGKGIVYEGALVRR